MFVETTCLPFFQAHSVAPLVLFYPCLHQEFASPPGHPCHHSSVAPKLQPPALKYHSRVTPFHHAPVPPKATPGQPTPPSQAFSRPRTTSRRPAQRPEVPHSPRGLHWHHGEVGGLRGRRVLPRCPDTARQSSRTGPTYWPTFVVYRVLPRRLWGVGPETTYGDMMTMQSKKSEWRHVF